MMQNLLVEAAPRRNRTQYRVDALARGLSVLAAFTETSERLTPREVARLIGVPLTTARRLLAALQADGHVERDEEGQYFLTLRTLDLGYGGSFGLSLGEIARVEAQHIHTELNAAVFVSIFSRSETISIVSLVRTGFLQPLPHRFPIGVTSSGKAYLAFCDPGIQAGLLDAMTWSKAGPNTITSRREFERELGTIRSRGYAINNEELVAGVVSVGAPILNADARPVAAISAQTAIGLTDLATIERSFAPRIVSAARRLTERVALMDLDEYGRVIPR